MVINIIAMIWFMLKHILNIPKTTYININGILEIYVCMRVWLFKQGRGIVYNMHNKTNHKAISVFIIQQKQCNHYNTYLWLLLWTFIKHICDTNIIIIFAKLSLYIYLIICNYLFIYMHIFQNLGILIW